MARKCLLTNWTWEKSYSGVLEAKVSYLKECVHQKTPRFTLWTSLDYQLFVHTQLQTTVEKYSSSAPGMVYLHYTCITYSHRLAICTNYSITSCLSLLLRQLPLINSDNFSLQEVSTSANFLSGEHMWSQKG